MSIGLATVLCFCHIVRVLPAPVPWMVQPQYPQLPWQPYQQQMEALQAMQMQQFQPPVVLNWPQPMPMILLPVDNDIITFDPETPNQQGLFKRINDKNIFEKERQKVLATSTPQHGEKHEEYDDDTVVVEAQSEKKEEIKERVFILVPNSGRFSIGGIIEAIPFLPFEVNVPDSIAWAWNGISSIISGIRQRLPFRPRPMMPVNQMEAESMKLLMKNMDTQNIMSNTAVVPMQVFFVVMPVQMAPAMQSQY